MELDRCLLTDCAPRHSTHWAAQANQAEKPITHPLGRLAQARQAEKASINLTDAPHPLGRLGQARQTTLLIDGCFFCLACLGWQKLPSEVSTLVHGV